MAGSDVAGRLARERCCHPVENHDAPDGEVPRGHPRSGELTSDDQLLTIAELPGITPTIKITPAVPLRARREADPRAVTVTRGQGAEKPAGQLRTRCRPPGGGEVAVAQDEIDAPFGVRKRAAEWLCDQRLSGGSQWRLRLAEVVADVVVGEHLLCESDVSPGPDLFIEAPDERLVRRDARAPILLRRADAHRP
jgi:hypothetical protein